MLLCGALDKIDYSECLPGVTHDGARARKNPYDDGVLLRAGETGGKKKKEEDVAPTITAAAAKANGVSRKIYGLSTR